MNSNPNLVQDMNEILSLQDQNDKLVRELCYADKQLEYLTPVANNSNPTDVAFDLLPITDRMSSWKEAFLSFDLTITSTQANNAYTFPTSDTFFAVAPRSSLLSLIGAVDVRTGSGITIVSERGGATHFANHLRIVTEKDADWIQKNGSEIGFYKDMPDEDNKVGLVADDELSSPEAAKFSAAPTNALNNINPKYNKGAILRRQTLLTFTRNENTGALPANGSTSFTAKVKIPLKYIHDFFRQLDFPIVNTRLLMQFYLNTHPSAQHSPFHTFDINGSPVGGSLTYSYADVKMYYHSLKLKAEESAMVAQMLQQGFSKNIVFKQYDLFVGKAGAINTQNETITTSAVQPKKLWILAYPTGGVVNSSLSSVLTTGAHTITNTQIYLNNRNYFQNAIRDVREGYEHLKECCDFDADGDSKSYITFEDFKTRMRLNGFSLARASSLAIDPNAPVQIRAQFDVPVASDLIYLVESNRVCNLRISSSEVQVVVAPALSS